jgi:hypothetical protein
MTLFVGRAATMVLLKPICDLAWLAILAVRSWCCFGSAPAQPRLSGKGYGLSFHE